ncbi:MAG TPA: phosphoenolpyruvate carboxylase [Steroidobacteraceae bacterium]|nr:phosphoenolpyruvate carboxylase [Steroidobacteraceae bacterium]
MPRKDISFAAKDTALRDDVHTLGALVGEVLREQGGDALFAEVEGDRQLAIGRRDGDCTAGIELVVRAETRSSEQAADLIRAFTTWFQMVNMAEKVHRVRRRRDYLNDSSRPQPGGLTECFQRLRTLGYTLEQTVALLGRLSIEPVLTAHPTESTRRTLLRQQQRIASLLISRLDPSQTPAERRMTLDRVRTELTTGWQTAENSRDKLTVADEREHVLFFLVEVVYEIIPLFYEAIEESLSVVYGAAAHRVEVPEVLHFGSWVGGDMDGLPDVHAKTIRESCARHHALIVNRYFLEALALAETLSQSERRTPGIPQAVYDRIEHYRSVVPAAKASTPSGHDEMPYRVLLNQVAERLRATYDHSSGQYERVEQLVDDLTIVLNALEANRGRWAGMFMVRRFLRRVRTFGFHLATLDVRQNAAVHRQIVGRALGEEGWEGRTAVQRAERLREALARDESPPDTLEAAAKRALWVFEAMKYCRHRYGASAVGSYVVSMARDVDDMLAVLLLARWAGYAESGCEDLPLDVAPLFESVDALDAAGDTLRRLLADPLYRTHLRGRGNRQVVMLGYADSSKEAGILASRWLLRKAQVAMLATCAEAGVELSVFHGRGASVSRGGSRTEAVVSSLPDAVAAGRLRMTEQGETINDRYGLQPIALRTFEQALNTLARACAGDRRETVQDGWTEAIEWLAQVSQRRYREFVHDDPAFFDFFQAVTPVDVIERMQIGSRPLARREVGTGVDAIRAVPWSFGWSQSRHMLPGWFGAGAGLAAMIERFGQPLADEMYQKWPFFAGLIDDVEMRLARADLGIAQHYEKLYVGDAERFVRPIREEYERTRELVLRLKGCHRLLDSEPTLQRSIWLRNPYVDPIHLMQVELLRRWRAAGSPGDKGLALEDPNRQLFQALVASVNGIAHGLQGTA